MKLLLPILLFSICAHAQVDTIKQVHEVFKLKDGTRVLAVYEPYYLFTLDSTKTKGFGIQRGLQGILVFVTVPDSLGWNIEVKATSWKKSVPVPPKPTVTVNIDDRDPSIKYTGGWDNSCKTCIENYNSTITFSNVAGSSFEYTFTGKSITWIGERVSHHGIAGIKIDSQPEEIYDLYSAQPKKKEVIFKKGWETSGTHKVVVRVTGQKNNASSGFYVVNDMFIVEK